MKLFAKRALLLTVFVLCLFALTVLAASAATYTDDDAARTAGAVARIGAEGGDGYYNSLKEALDTIPANGEATVHLLADLTYGEAEYKLTGVTLTIEGHGKTITSSTPNASDKNGTFKVVGGATLNVNNVVFDGYNNKNLIYFGGDTKNYAINFTGVTANYASSGIFYGYGQGFTCITLLDCTFNVAATGKSLMNFTNAASSKNVAFVIVNTAVTNDCADVNATYAANVWVARPNQYTTDDEAVAAGAVARVGAEGTGLYYTDLRSAIETCPTGGTVTVLQDATLMGETTLLNKTVTVVGKEKYAITVQKESRTFAFEMNGTSTLNLNNLSISCGTSSVGMNLMYISETTTTTAVITVNMTDVDVTWVGGSGALYFVGGARADVYLKNCTFTSTTETNGVIRITVAMTNGCTMVMDNVTLNTCVPKHTGTVGVANVFTASTTLDEAKHVASFEFEGVAYYYTSVVTAINEAVGLGVNNVVVFANAEENAQVTLAAGTTLTIVGVGETAPVITFTGTDAMLLLGNQVDLTLSNLTVNAASSSNGVIKTSGAASKDAANATVVTLTNVTLSAASKTINFQATPYITVNATGVQLLADAAPTVYAQNSGSSVITLNFTDTLMNQKLQIGTVTANFNNVAFSNDAVAASNNTAGSATYCLYRLNNNKVGGDGAYADYTTGYYTSLANAVAAMQNGDTVYSTSNASALVAKGVYDDDNAAVADGLLFRIGEGANQMYVTTLNNAVSLAASGDTITVLANTTLSSAITLDSKALTIQGASKGVVLTTSAAITLTADASLRISDMTLDSSATFIKTSTATNGNSFSLENVDLHVSAMTADVGFIAPTTQIAIEITDVDITTTVGEKSAGKYYAVWIINVGAGGTVAPLSITNTTTTTPLVRVASSTAVVGTSDVPATLTDVTMTNGCPFYGYGGTIYANVFGGSFVGALLYGGDGSNNTLDIKVNPTGDKTTTFTREGTSNSAYSAWVHLNPTAVHNVSFLLRNLSYTDTGAAPLFAVRAAANLSISVESCTFNMNGAKLSNFPASNGVCFNSDATARQFGYGARIGDEGASYYYDDVYYAMSAVADGDTIWIFDDITQTGEYELRKTITIRGVDGVQHTVSTTATVPFMFETGANLTLADVYYELGVRFGRFDGETSTLTLASGAYINHTNTENNGIFLYNNGNGKDAEGNLFTSMAYTIDIQEGATVKSTTTLASGLIYHNGGYVAGGVQVTVKLLGVIDIPNAACVLKDASTNKGVYNVTHIDVSKITCNADKWFVNAKMFTAPSAGQSTVLYAKGFADAAQAAAWGYNQTSATGMTYIADPSAEWNYAFIEYTQFTPQQAGFLNSYGGEIWQLKSVGSIYTTVHFKNQGTVTIKSYEGAKIVFQGNAYRITVTNTTLILDGIELSSPGAVLSLKEGSAASPSVLKMVNGAKITGSAVSTRVSGESFAALVCMEKAYTSLYVDETSSMSQTGTLAEDAAYGALNVFAYSGWSNGEIVIEGSLTSTVTSPTQTVALIRTHSTAATNAGIVLDGAKLSASANATNSYTIDAPNGYSGYLGVSDDVSLGNTTNVSFSVAEAMVSSGEAKFTLADAMKYAKDGDTIYLLEDLSVSTGLSVSGKSLTLASATGSTYTLTNASSGYLFTVADGAKLTLSNIKVATDGALVTASGSAGAFTLGAGTTVTGAAKGTPFFNVSAAFTGGVITMESGSKLEITAVSAATNVFSVSAAMSTVDLQGEIVMGSSAAPVAVAAASKLMNITSGLSTINVGGTINLYGTGNSVAFANLAGSTARTITFTGIFNAHFTGCDSATRMQFLIDQTARNNVVVDGANISFSYDGKNDVYVALFYIRGSGNIVMTSGTITVGKSGQNFPIIYSAAATCSLTVSGNSTLINNGTGTDSVIICNNSATTASFSANEKGTPAVAVSANTNIVAMSTGSLNINNVVVAGGKGWGAKTTTIAEGSFLYFATDAAAAQFGYPLFMNAEVLGGEGAYKEAKTGYYKTLADAVAAVPDGGASTLYVFKTIAISSEVVINNKNITLVGTDIAGYHISSTASYAFRFDNLGTLTLQDMRISATQGLIRYQGVASAIASANRDIYINFINTVVDANGAANYLITSVAHHGDTSSTAADQIKKCDSVTVVIDEDSKINFTTSATGEVKVIRYDHNTHSTVYTFIYGDVTVNATGDADAYFYLVRSNNPTKTQITVGEKANISITLAPTRQTNGKSYFTSCVGGSSSANKLYLHADAISDDNGELTLGGVKLYTNYYDSIGYEVVITAKNTLAETAIYGLIVENASGVNSGANIKVTNPVIARACVDGVYYYTSILATAFAKLNDMESTGSLYMLENASISTGLVLDGVDFTLAAAEGVVLTSSAANLFTLTNGASLSVEDMAINITAETTGIATNGALIAMEDAQATAKVSVTLTDLTVTGSKAVLFYFGGESEADVEIVGGSYAGKGVFSFGNYVGGDNGTNAVVNLTVTGTDADHVTLASSGREVILIRTETQNKEQVHVVFDYVDVTSTGADTVYMRGLAALNYTHSNGSITAQNSMVLTSQGSCAPFFTYNNVEITNLTTGFLFRPYGKSGSGAYLNFNDCEINATNCTTSVLAASTDVDVLLSGCTVNAPKAANVCGSAANTATVLYTLEDCIFTIGASAQIPAGADYNVLATGVTTVNGAVLTGANAPAYGLHIEIGKDSGTFLPVYGTRAVNMATSEGKALVLLSDLVLPAATTYSGITLTIEGYTPDITITKAGEINEDSSYAKVDNYLFNVGSRTNLTFKNITVKSVRIINITANESGASVTITLDEGTLLEALPNKSAYTGDAALIYKNTSNVDVTINVNQGATMLVPATETVNNALIFLNNAASGTVNVYGTMKNLATVATGASAQVFIAKTNCNAFLNVYDGAVIEGTSDSVANDGDYAGIVYYSAATLNGINIEGGTITIHGRTGLAYTGTKCNIHISGGTISNTEAQYPMFYGGNQTATILGTDAVKPTFNTPAKLMGKGTATAVNYFTVENHAPLAKTLGFAVLLASKNTSYTDMAVARDAAAAEDTYYLLSDVSTGTAFAASFFTNRKLTITSYGNAKYTWTTTNASNGVVFYMGNNSHLIIDNIIMNVGCRILRFESDGDVGGYTKLDIMGGTEIYALPAGDGNFFYYSANRVLTMNIEEGAIIQRKGESAGSYGYLFNLGKDFAAGSVVNIKGKISDVTKYTGTGTRSVIVFQSQTANIAVNVYASADLEAALTKAEDAAKISTTLYHAEGYTYFKGFADSAARDERAREYGLNVRTDATPNDDTAYHKNLSFVWDRLDTATAAIYVIGAVTVSSELKILDQNITVVGVDFDGDYHLNVTARAFAIYSKGTLTFENLRIHATAQLVDYNANEKVAGEKAAKDVVINFRNTDVTVEGSTTLFIASRNHYYTANGGCGEQGDSATVNVDSASTINVTTTTTGSYHFINFNHNTHSYVYANIDGAVTINSTGETLSEFHFIHSNNPSLTHLNVSETASLSISLVAECESAYLVTYSTGNTANHKISIAAEAIFDSNGALMLDGTKIYYASAALIPQVDITATTEWAQEALKEWIAKEEGEDVTPIQYRVDFDGKLHYYNLYDLAKSAADANGTTIIYISASVLPNVEAAVAAGAIFRLGAATDAGTLGVNYFINLEALVDYAIEQKMTDITVWVLTEGMDESQITLTGIKLTLDSIDAQQTLTMTANPVFLLDAGAHLVVKNVKLEITNAFAQVVNADTTKEVKLDLEEDAYVDIKYAYTSSSNGYFLKTKASTPTGIITANVKEGSTINRVTSTATSSNCQGLFQFRVSGNACAVGSSLNIDGTIKFGLTYNSSGGQAPVVMLGDKNLIVNIGDSANIDLCHKNATKSVWGAIICVDSTGVTANVGNATLAAAQNLALFGVNNLDLSATLIVTGATFTAENFPMAVVNEHTTSTSDNTQVVTFRDCTFGCKVSANDRMTNVVLENATFNSVAHATANYAALRVGESATTGYYSQNALAQAATAANGGTVYVLKDFTTTQTYEMRDVSFTLASPAGERYTITSHLGGNNGSFLLTFRGSCNVTLQNLDINGKGRTFAYRESTAANAPSSLRLLNADIYGVASGTNANAMLDISGSQSAGYHDTQYFSLYIDADSSMGYRDGDPASIRSTRNYQVIFYYAPVTGDVVIEGEVYAYVYFTGDQVDYEKVGTSWTSYGPNGQKMISIGNDNSQPLTGNIIITGKLTHKVVFPDKDEKGNPVYPEDHKSAHTAYAIYAFGTNASVFVADSAVITTDYTNEYKASARVGFSTQAYVYDTVAGTPAVSGELYYTTVASLFSFLNNHEYKDNKLAFSSANTGNLGIVYDNTTHYTETTNDDDSITYAYGYDYKGAKEIAELLSTLTGASFTHSKDSGSFTYEIVVGIANRDLVQTYLPQLEMNEYAIIVENNKVLILAWHNAALNVGVTAFKSVLNACTVNGTVYLPNIGGKIAIVANTNWIDDFSKPEDGTLWGGQYVNDNSLQYVYSGYTTQSGQAAFMAYCSTLVADGYALVWQNVIENNLFRLYQNTATGHALYVAYNDYAYKDEFIAKYAEEESALPQDEQFKDLEDSSILGQQYAWAPDFSDDYFENRDHQKVIRVVSMPLASVTMPDNGILVQDMSYEKVTNTLQTTLSFDGSSVGMGQVYMLEDGSFLVVDGGGTGNAGYDHEDDTKDKHPGDVPEQEAIWQVILKMYQQVHGTTPEENGDTIHIAAWYLTHAHWDHISAFTNFMKEHGAELTMDYIIANVPVQESAYWNAELSISHATLKNTILGYASGGKKTLIRPQTGQRLYLANLEIEVLMTYEDHAPFDIINSNDTNTVTRFKIHNQDALNGVTTEMIYLGDSWRHSSRILCEMYGSYLETEIVQLAHHGNIGCERILYKTINAKAVYFSHDGDSFQSYMYWGRLSAKEKAAAKNAFCYAADIWAVQNAEYTWSAPYGTYNVLEFLPARPNYEGMYELGIQPGAVAGTLISADSSKYGSYTGREQSKEYIYIHNPSKGYQSVNVIWGDLSFTYDAGVQGTWNAETHQYDGAVAGKGWVASGDNRIFVGNASTGSNQTINVELTYNAADGYENFTGTFSDNGAASIASKGTKMFTFHLGTSALPAEDITDQVVGSITVSLK